MKHIHFLFPKALELLAQLNKSEIGNSCVSVNVNKGWITPHGSQKGNQIFVFEQVKCVLHPRGCEGHCWGCPDNGFFVVSKDVLLT